MEKGKRKIAYISDRFPHITETFTYYEVMGLKKEGLNLQVYSFKKADVTNLTSEMKEATKDTIYFPSFLSPKIYVSQFYFLYHIPIRYFHTLLKVIFGKYQRFTTFKLRLRSVVNFLRGGHLSFLLKDKRKFIHIHGQHASNAATAGYICNKLLNITFSFRNHTNYNPLILKDKLETAEFVLSISEFDRRQLLNWSDKVYLDKIKVDYLGVDVVAWKKETMKEENDLIFSVGRLGEKKGHEYLVIAGGILKGKGVNFSIGITGDGPMRNSLEEIVKQKGLSENIEISGYISHYRVKKMMERSSIFCLPCVITSHGNVDGIPIVLMEAMALSKPVISTDVSGIPELIDNGISGILVPGKDPIALASALEKLLKDFKLRESLGKAARKKIERDFNLQKNIRKTVGIFREHIDG